MTIEVNGISKTYTGKKAVDNVSFTAEAGKALGILGRNGAGKTTTIRILMNVIRPESGSVTLDGKPINYDRVRIGYLPEERGLYAKKELFEQLVYFARLKGMPRGDAARSVDRWLDRLGLTRSRIQAAHCVWLEPEDMALLARHKVTAVHCPVSNLKLASGRADVISMIKAGMNVALGTDGASSNNNLDLFEEIKTASLLAKSLNADPNALPPQAALMMATVCGARAQGREAECGMIKPGLDADLILLDFTSPHLMPCHDVMSHLCYAARGSDVLMTMVRGKILYAAGKYETIDLDAVVRELAEHAMPTVFRDRDQ